MVAFWETPDQLGKEATYALLEIKKSRPAIGWAKANEISEKDSRLKIAELGEENRLLRQALSIHESKDFKPILDGLSGDIEIQKYEYSGEIDDGSWPIGGEPSVGIRDGLTEFKYQAAEGTLFKPASWVMERICFGFLFGRDFADAAKKGLSSPHPIGSPGSSVYLLTNEHSLEPKFMALEGAGLIRPGEPYDGVSAFWGGRRNNYLRRTPWKLSEDFRRWIVKQGEKPI